MLFAAVTVQEVALAIRGQLHGDPTLKLTGIKPLESATSSDLSLFAPTSKRKTAELFQLAKTTKAGALLVPSYDKEIQSAQIVVPHPFLALAEIAKLFYRAPKPKAEIHERAVVDPSATIGANVSIGAYAVIGENVTIEDGVCIYPSVVVYAGAHIGRDTIIHAGAVIREFVKVGAECLIQPGVIVGGDGFGYLRDPVIGHRHIPHVGTVVLEDRVDVGANSTIDRGTLGETRVKESAKIDNLVTLGHNVVVGRRSLLCGQVGISGSAAIGNDVVLGGQVGVADHVTVADGVRAAAKTGISTDVLEKLDVAGYPPIPVNEWKRQMLLSRRLGELFQSVKKLTKRPE